MLRTVLGMGMVGGGRGFARLVAAAVGALWGLAGYFPVAWAAPTDELHFLDRSGFIADDTIQKFEAETGIKVVFDTYRGDERAWRGLQAGNPQHWDLVVVSTVPVLAFGVPAHLFQPLNPSSLGNYANVDTDILAAIAPYDPGNKVALPFLWGTTGLAINKARLQKLLPAAPLDSLALLFDPALAHRAAACGLAVEDVPEAVIPAALAYLGLDPTSEDKHDLDRAGVLLMKAKPYLKRLPPNDFVEGLTVGRICVGFGASVSATDARSRADERDTGEEVTYFIPKERARMWVDVLAIPANAVHAKAARAFMNFLLRPEIISDITDWTGAANPNMLAADFVDDEDKLDETVFPSRASRARLFLDKPQSAEVLRLKHRIWTETKP